MNGRTLAASVLAFLFLAACVYAGSGTSGANYAASGTSVGTITAGDWVAPVVTVTSPVANARTGLGTPTFTGAAGTISGDLAPVTIRIYSGTGTSGALAGSGTTNAGSNGAWSMPSPLTLSDGTYTVQASQADVAGNTGRSSAVTFTVDRTPPSPAVTAPTGYVGVGRPALEGTAGDATGDAAGLTVEIRRGAALVDTLTPTRSGTTWTATPSASLAEGTYTVTAIQSDDVGNTGASPLQTFTVDQTAPAVALSTPTSGSSFKTRVPVISGAAGGATGDLPAITVNIYSGTGTSGSAIQTLTPTASGGAWSATAASLADGTYTAQATQADQAGNTGTSAAVTFTVDNVPPAPTVTAPSGYVKTLSPTISGTAANAAGDDTSVTVEVLSGASVIRTMSAPVSGTATWTTPVSPALPADGAYTVRAKQSDAAGHTGTSAAVTFTVDTVAPLAPVVSGPTTWAKSRTPVITGTAANGTGDNASVVVEILSSGSVVQTLSAPRSGTTWSVSPTALTEGATYSVRAREGDQAGNTSGNSALVTFTVDSIAPAVTLTAPAANSYLRTTTPTISGAGGTAANDGSITVTIRTSAGVFVQSKTVAASATWTTAPTVLAQGTYTVQATQSDAAGNVGASATNTFTVDTVAPTAAGLSAVNGTGTAGWLDSGDAITFSYNEAILPSSVLAGFTGAATPVKVTFTNGGGKDTFTVLDSAGGTTVHLASSVATFANYLQTGNVTFAASMVQSADKKSIVVTLGTPDIPGNLRSQAVTKAQDMTWTLSAGVTDLAGNALVTPGTFAESDNDVDF